MTAHLDIAWQTQDHSTVLLTALAPRANGALTRKLTTARQPARCPVCDSIVYSRRHKHCGVCNQRLPDDLLFTDQESRRIEALLCTERTRHRQWLHERAS